MKWVYKKITPFRKRGNQPCSSPIIRKAQAGLVGLFIPLRFASGTLSDIRPPRKNTQKANGPEKHLFATFKIPFSSCTTDVIMVKV